MIDLSDRMMNCYWIAIAIDFELIEPIELVVSEGMHELQHEDQQNLIENWNEKLERVE